jgi:UDP-N-acetylglucosamine 3-dehydrogenase
MTDGLSIAVVGLGFGANHARVLDEMPGVRLAAVCDADAARLATVAAAHNVTPYESYEALLRREKPGAVVVAVPARLHEAVAGAAIDAGCAVFVEKPLAPSLGEGQRLAAAAAMAGVVLMPGHLERFNPAVQELVRRVQTGEIGRVLQLMARRMGPIVVRTQDVNIVHDSALHDIDVMRYVLGSEVERAYAEAQADVLMPFEDSISGVLRFGGVAGRPGAVGSLDVNWLSPRRTRELRVLGEDGLFVLDYVAQTLELDKAKEASPRETARQPWSPATAQPNDSAVRIPVEPKEPLQQELAAFVAAVRDGTPPPVTPHDALAALAVADALTESARTGQPVRPRAI